MADNKSDCSGLSLWTLCVFILAPFRWIASDVASIELANDSSVVFLSQVRSYCVCCVLYLPHVSFNLTLRIN